MTQEKYQERLVLILILLLGFIHSVIVLRLSVLPFVDVPFHLAAATIVKDFNNPSNEFSDFFTISMSMKPNVFHLWFCSLSLFPSPEAANRFYFGIYFFLLPLSMFVVIKKIDGNVWASLLSFFFLYNFNTHWGLVNFMFSVPVIVLFFWAMVKHFENPSSSTRILLGAISFFLFFVHAVAALFSILLLLLFSLVYNRGRLINLFRDLLLLLPLILMISLWWSGSEGSDGQTFEHLRTYYTDYYLQTIWYRSGMFSFDNYYLYDGIKGHVFGVALSVMSTFPFLLALIFERDALRRAVTDPKVLPVILLFIASLGCFIALPQSLGKVWLIFMRFSVLVYLGLILFISKIEMKRFSQKIIIAGIVAACLTHTAVYADFFGDFRKSSSDFTRATLPEYVKGEKLAALIFDFQFRGVPAYIHFPNYFIIWKKGIATTKLLDYRFFNVRRNVSFDDFPAYVEWIGCPQLDNRKSILSIAQIVCSYVKEAEESTYIYEGQYSGIFDYVLVRGDVPADFQHYLKGYRLGNRSGSWKLYKKNRQSGGG